MEDKSWTTRMTDMIYGLELEEGTFFELLEEDWTVQEYMDAVSGLGEPGVWIGHKSRFDDQFNEHCGVCDEQGIDEAVLADRDYEYDGKVIKISKKNFSKVHRDFKNSTKGKETMITYDSREGTVLVPVEFTEEVVEGWKRAEYVNSLIIDYLKNGRQTVM